MGYNIVFSSAAAKDIQKLEPVLQKRLQKKFTLMTTQKDIRTTARALVNHEAGEYRIRVGDYRVIFDLDGDTIFVLRVRHRKDVYR